MAKAMIVLKGRQQYHNSESQWSDGLCDAMAHQRTVILGHTHRAIIDTSANNVYIKTDQKKGNRAYGDGDGLAQRPESCQVE